jgi:hypothetical protein
VRILLKFYISSLDINQLRALFSNNYLLYLSNNYLTTQNHTAWISW